MRRALFILGFLFSAFCAARCSAFDVILMAPRPHAATPPTGITDEDGTTYLTDEDGTTYLIQD